MLDNNPAAPTYSDAVMQEMTIKRNVARYAHNMMELSVMALPREERRRLAKINGIKNIVGSTQPFKKDSTAR